MIMFADDGHSHSVILCSAKALFIAYCVLGRHSHSVTLCPNEGHSHSVILCSGKALSQSDTVFWKGTLTL